MKQTAQLLKVDSSVWNGDPAELEGALLRWQRAASARSW